MVSPKDPPADVTVYYKGVGIKVSPEWQKKHPGGDKVLKIFHNRDATDIMTAMHSEQAQKMLIAMAKSSCAGDSEEFTSKMESYKDSHYMKLYQKAKELNLFEPNLADEIFKSFYSFGSVFLGVYLSCSAAMGHRVWLGASFIAFGWFQLGWLGHDWSHHTYLPKSNSKWCRVNDWLAWWLSVIRGTTLLNWKLRHNTHHCCTNEIGNDPDIRLSPLLHFFEEFEVNGLTAWQHVYYLPSIGLLHIYWHYESWMASIKNSKGKNLANRFWAQADFLCLSLHWVFLISIIYFSGHVLPLVYAYYMSGFGTAIVVFSSHYGEERLIVEKAKDGESPAHIGLFEETSKTVRNITSFSGAQWEESFWFWLTGGLNVQFEHHMFPMMPRCNLCIMKSAIKQVCAEHNFEFRESSLYGCVVACLLPLKKNVETNLKRMCSNLASRKASAEDCAPHAPKLRRRQKC